MEDANATIATHSEGERDQQTAALEDANATIATLGGERDQQTAALEDANAKIAALEGERDRLAAERSQFFTSLSEILEKREGHQKRWRPLRLRH